MPAPTFSALTPPAGTATAATSFNTASVTPTANRLVLVAVNVYVSTGSLQPPIPTVTGNGITYALIRAQDIDAVGADRSRLYLFRGMSAAPTAGAITLNFGSTINKIEWAVVQSDGNVDTSGSNGSGAIVSANISGDTSSVTVNSQSSNYPVAMTAGNSGFCVVGNQTADAQTPRAGWTEVTDGSVSLAGMSTQYIAGTDTAGGSSWTTLARAASIVIEVKAASGATSVGRSLSTTWDILGTVGKSLGTTWDVAGTVGRSLFTGWAVSVEHPHLRVKFPTYKVPVGRGRLFSRFSIDAEVALVKTNGEWIEVIVPSQELLRVAEKYYLGGYTYILTDLEAADLPSQYVEEI